MRIMLMFTVAAALLFMSGCLKTPAGFVEFDADGDGLPDAYAVDTDEDGEITEADYTDGEPVLVNRKLVSITSKADAFGPDAVAAAGALAGIPFLAALAVFLKKLKPGKILRDTVLAVQVFREEMRKKNGDILALMDKTLGDELDARSKAEIARIKAKAINGG